MSMKTNLLATVTGLAMFGMASAASALPSQATFTAAGLGAIGGWTLIGPPEIFGTGGSGNGFLNGGGLANFVLRDASFGHRFGVADDDDNSSNRQDTRVVILDTAVNSVGQSVPFANPDTGGGIFDFVFYFQTYGTGTSDDGFIFSDDSDGTSGQRDMAIYRQGDVFAFFYDDAGGSPDDNDFNDMVVTATLVQVPEPMTLGLLGAGLIGLGAAARRRRQS